MFFVRKQRLPGLGVERRKPRSQFLVSLTSILGWRKSIACHIAGLRAVLLASFKVGDLHPRTFHLHRKFTRARHLWLSLRPNWSLMRTHMYADWPGNCSCARLNDRLFNNSGRNDLINDTRQGGFLPFAHQEWQQQGLYMAQFMGSGPCRITMTLEATLLRLEACLATEQQEVEEQKESRGQVKRWRTRQGVLQVKAASPTREASPIAVDAEFEEVLRDV